MEEKSYRAKWVNTAQYFGTIEKVELYIFWKEHVGVPFLGCYKSTV